MFSVFWISRVQLSLQHGVSVSFTSLDGGVVACAWEYGVQLNTLG